MSKVYLIGAGPGDPGLLTIKARDVLSKADVVVYDYLANKIFLKNCREDAEIIYVGKKGGDHTLPQAQINELLVQKALDGKIVARLKGGDPYIFGRGAEEAQELLEAGAEFEVIPGVTSAVAAPAYAGIPLTHRKYASSVSFITGHEDPDKPESAHNWHSLATGTSTLVFFMGVKNLPHISKMLIQHGMRPDMPVALVRWGTTCKHKSLVSTLQDIPDEAARQGFKPPSLIIVGEVVCLRDELNWFEKLPLLGKGVVVTRAREQASSLLAQLSDLGACCFEFPTIQINPLDDYLPLHDAISKLHQYNWVVFTSVNGVRFFWQELVKAGLDARALGNNKVAAIGPATAEALEQRGINADFVPERYVAESVVQGMLQLGVMGQKVLIPRAKVAREVLPQELMKAGADVEIVPVYETGLTQEDDSEIVSSLEKGEIHYITFTSSSTVENFFSLVAPEHIAKNLDKGIKLVCIGPVTDKTLQGFGFKSDIMPDDYTIPGVIQELIKDSEMIQE
ncbi:uroporphyrinogen-III C-methyltransferase [Desulfonatronovibrio magnus]|uniref:uroporphyrinogen-III C-methyltransferase n=1 Tax=Desulfonatronovibrio magnus TaxID=698827 RepID=UPI0005EB8E16|nr:uroporphyrinogen-III C-methyltransferase [Desulfonatronovibrio magnus]